MTDKQMRRVPSSSDIPQLGQSLLLGTKRRPLTLPSAVSAMLSTNADSPHPAIVALTLAGQYSRFQRPGSPASETLNLEAQPLHDDPRPMLSGISRKALKQLLGMLKNQDAGAFFTACLDEIARRELRLHPFDLPELGRLLRQSDARLHRAVLPPLPNADTLHRIDADELKRMEPDLCMMLLRELREADPATARDRIEELWGTMSADRRAELLDLLSNRLGPDDCELLAKAAQDRAKPVKTVAQTLLGRLTGTNEYETRLGRAVAALSVKTGRKPQQKRKLVLNSKQLTGHIRGRHASAVSSALLGLLPGDIARQLDLSEDDLLGLLPDSEFQIALAFAGTAASRNNRQQLEILLPLLADSAAIKLFVNDGFGTSISEDSREMLTARFAAIVTQGSLPDGITFLSLYQHARAPLREDMAHALIRSRGWRNHVADLGKDTDTNPKAMPNALAEAALLIPAVILDEFLASFADIPAHLAGTARAVVTFRQSLTRTDPILPIAQSAAESRK
ncbi:MAG: hypothetical protein KTR19_02470 [Hyphomicrobiales bacterium]|nr:hypothetical protein [Hyphomicrobiales bacterium]